MITILYLIIIILLFQKYAYADTDINLLNLNLTSIPTSSFPSSSQPSTSPSSSQPSSFPSSSQPTSYPTQISCKLGEYRSENGVCKPCDPGYYSDIVDADSPEDHFRWVCFKCPMGTYAVTPGLFKCTPCPLDTYSSSEAAKNESTCNPCPYPYVTRNVGSTSFSDCLLGPRLLNFDFDKSLGRLTLEFDSAIQPRSFITSQVTFYGAKISLNPNISIPTMTLTRAFNNLANQRNGTSLFVLLDADDYARFLMLGPSNLGSNKNNLYLTLGKGAVRNLNDTINHELRLNESFLVRNFFPDTAAGLITNFAIDMHRGILSLEFTKPVDQASIIFSNLIFQNERVVCQPPDCLVTKGVFYQMAQFGYSFISYENYQRKITLSMGSYNKNRIAEIAGLCSSLANCFASANESFIKDVSGTNLPLAGFEKLYSMKASAYITDLTNPILLSWNFDYNTGTIFLTFDKTVYASYLNTSGVVLISSPNISTGIQFRISNPDLISTKNSDIMEIVLNEDQLDGLRDNPGILKDSSNSYIILEPGLIRDTTVNLNPYLGDVSANATNPMRINDLADDVTPPTISYFDLNLTSRILSIRMSKIISKNSIQLNSLSLQSDKSATGLTEKVIFSSSNSLLLNTKNTNLIQIFMDQSYQLLRGFRLLGKSAASTFLAATTTFLKDTSPAANQLIPVSSLSSQEVRNYFPDLIPPNLLTWNIDMSNDELNLFFSEPVNTTTFNFSALTLQSDKNLLPSTVAVSLDKSASIKSFAINNGIYSIVIKISENDANLIKSTPPLCQGKVNCFLTISPTLCFDTSTFTIDSKKNSIEFKNRITTFQPTFDCDIFTPDTTSPTLKSYTIDMNTGKLKLQFSEPVNFNTFDASGIIFRNTSSGSTYKLSSNSYPSDLSLQNITVTFSLIDFVNLKAKQIAASINNVFLQLTTTSCKDIAGNALSLMLSPIPPVLFFADVTPPEILAVAFNRNKNIDNKYLLTVYFNDAVKLETFIAGNLDVIRENRDRVLDVEAKGPNQDAFDYKVIVELSARILDINRIQQKDILVFFKSINSVRDVSPLSNGNFNKGIENRALEGNRVYSFRLNLAEGTIILEFVYLMFIDEIDYTKFTIQTDDQVVQYKLTGNGQNHDKTQSYQYITLKLNPYDVDFLNANFASIKKENIVLSFQETAIYEERKNEDVTKISLGKLGSIDLKVPCSQLIVDTKSPELKYWLLDLDSGILELTFTKTIQRASVKVSGIKFLSSRTSSPSSIITLQQSSVINPTDTSTVRISLNSGNFPTDRDRINMHPSIGFSLSSLYLAIDSGSMKDTALLSSFFTGINSSMASGGLLYGPEPYLKSFTQDTTAPKLDSFDLDLTTRTITLKYDEAVNGSTCITSYFTLLEDPNDALSEQYSLLSSQVIYDPTYNNVGTTVKILLSQNDLDAILLKAPNLCYSKDNTYLAFSPNSIRDISKNFPSPNGISAKLFRFGVKVSNYVNDKNPPAIIQYNLTLTDKYIDFSLNKVVKCSKTDASKIRFQYASFAGTSDLVYQLDKLESYPSCIEENTKSIRVVIGLEDLLRIQSYETLLKSKATTFLRLDGSAFFDVFDFANVPILDGSSLNVNNYIGDFNPPRLLSFTISSLFIMTLTFNKPLFTQSLKINTLRVQNGIQTSTFTPAFYFLTESFLIYADPLKLSFQVQLGDDYNRIAASSNIFKSQLETFLTASSITATDMFNNKLMDISPFAPLALGPSITSWDIRMDVNLLILYFSEPVRGPFYAQNLKIQSDFTFNASTTKSVTLTSTIDAKPSETDGNSTYHVPLNSFDINTLKLYKFGQSELNNYLVAPFAQTSSTKLGTIIPYLKTIEISQNTALIVRKIFFDQKPPDCLYFNINLNIDTLYIVFDEPVDVSSFIPNYITLVSEKLGSYVILSGAINSRLENLTTLSLNFNQNDIVLIDSIFKNDSLNLMYMYPASVKDFSRNAFAGNDYDNPIRLNNYTKDTTPPVLVSFTLDLADLSLTVTFNKQIDMDYMMPNQFTISSEILKEKYTFTYRSLLSNPSPISITLNFGLLYYDSIELFERGITEQNSSDIFINVSDFQDIFGNRVTFDQKINCTEKKLNTMPPFLKSFDLLHSTVTSTVNITFYFSYPINILTFRCSDFNLRSSNIVNAEEVRVLDDNSCDILTNISESKVTIRVNSALFQNKIGNILDDDWTEYTWISTKELPIYTTGRNKYPIRAIDPSKAIRVGPRLIDFFLNMITNELVLMFSKDVNRTTFDSSGVGIYSAISRKTEFLSSDYVFEKYFSYSTEIDFIGKIILNSVDMINLKAIDLRSNQLFLVSKPDMVYDIDNIGSSPLSVSDFITSSRFTIHTEGPVILKLALNMATSMMLFEFDEPIRESSIVLKNFRLQSSALTFNVSYKLTSADISVYKQFLNVSMSLVDSSAIKLNPILAKTLDSSFFSCTFNTIMDIADNIMRPISTTDARRVDTYIADSLRPFLVSFDLDMNIEVLVLHFSEPIISSTFDVTQITIQNGFLRDSSSSFYRLSSSSQVISPSGIDMAIKLSPGDIFQIKNSINLARAASSTFIIFNSSLASDTSNNPVVPILDGNALLCSMFIRDSTRPEIIYANFNVDQSLVTVGFSELVQSNVVQANGLTIQGRPTKSPGMTITLSLNSKSITSAIYSESIDIKVATDDMNAIKSLYPLLSSKNDTYISVSSSFVVDTYNNPVENIFNDDALQVKEWFPDKSPPVLTYYYLNMRDGEITLIFDEAVDPKSLDLSELIIQTKSIRKFGKSTNFVGADFVIGKGYGSNILEIIIQGTLADYIKTNEIGIDKAFGLLSWSDKFISDFSGNFLKPVWDGSILNSYPISPEDFTPDEQSPSLNSWLIDREEMIFSLKFDEAVNILNITYFKIWQGLPSLNKLLYSFTSVLSVELNPDDRKNFYVKFADICTINADLPSCRGSTLFDLIRNSPQRFYLTVSSDAAQDLAKVPNKLSEIIVANPKPEGSPECGHCEPDSYVIQNCTKKSDRVCSSCTKCGVGLWAREKCTAYRDTGCAACSYCPHGQYISTECNSEFDTVCSACQICSGYEYPSTECRNGLNTVCGSCRVCTFSSPTVAKLCASGYYTWWALENCCFDKKGEKTACSDLSYVNLEIDAISGHHHWSFSVTSPKVPPGYELPKDFLN